MGLTEQQELDYLRRLQQMRGKELTQSEWLRQNGKMLGVYFVILIFGAVLFFTDVAPGVGGLFTGFATGTLVREAARRDRWQQTWPVASAYLDWRRIDQRLRQADEV